eukprot:2597102-Rhodomonas_salina.2
MAAVCQRRRWPSRIVERSNTLRNHAAFPVQAVLRLWSLVFDFTADVQRFWDLGHVLYGSQKLGANALPLL